MTRKALERAALILTAVFLALMAGWTLGNLHSRRLLQRTAPAALPVQTTPAPDDAPAPEVDFPLNINFATAEELTALPGIGQTRAEEIVAWRRTHGRFRSVTDLLNVPGIGEATLKGLLDYITVGG